MGPDDQSPEVEPLMREAIAWLVRLKSGEATVADAEQFKRWRDESPEHADAVKRAVKLWRSFEEAAAANAVDPPRRPPRLIGRAAENVPTRRAFIGGAAAAAAVAAGYLVVRPPLELWPSLEELAADYRTGKGEQLKVQLGPDVAINLGTLTSIAVTSDSKIRLIDGQAAITANMPPDRPLTVLANDAILTAADADFDARCINDVVSVTCVRGTIEVHKANQTVELKAGQAISYSGTGIASVKDVDIGQATSWRSGVLIFNDRPLAEVVEEINRYRPGRIFITNDAVRSRIVNGTFHRDQLDNFIAQVRQLFGAKVTILPAGVVLLS